MKKYPLPHMMVTISDVEPKIKVVNKAHIKTVGYIRFIRFLYQLKNPFGSVPKNNVYPEQKKKSASPMEPPVHNHE